MNTRFAIAALALTSTPAFAADASTALDAQVSAEIGYQDNGNNYDEPASNGATYSVNASVALPISQSIGLQADVSHSQDLMNLPYDVKLNNKSTSVGAHLFVRKSDKFLLGAIGQVNFNTISTSGYSIDMNQYFVGGEAQAYLKNVTLTAQVAYRKDEVGSFGYGPSSFGQSGVIATAQAKLFINSNWSLAAKGEYSNIKFSDSYDVNIDQWRLGLITERRLSSVPVSLLFKANYGESKVDGMKLRDTRFVVGIKINFGSQSLKARDRSGASLEGFKADALVPFIG